MMGAKIVRKKAARPRSGRSDPASVAAGASGNGDVILPGRGAAPAVRADAGAARAMEGALELVSEAVLITDAAGRVRSANPAAGALLGARSEDLPGEAIIGFVAPADR